MKRRTVLLLAGAGALALVPLFLPAEPAAVPSARGGIAQRLLGPFASLAAGVQWLRVRAALTEGRTALAFARAELALALDPGATHGWELLAAHQGFTLASAAREPDPTRRLAWLRLGAETARRGERSARDPAALALLAGTLWLVHAEQDAELSAPGGPIAARTLWEEAAAAFERAAALGQPDADELARWAAERAAE